jgi:chromate transport protein ChrA
MNSDYFFLFLHSLLRYGVLISVLVAGLVALRGFLMQRPILVGERMIAIIAMVLCHVQLVVGLVLYLMRVKSYTPNYPSYTFWKFEHIGTMIIAIILVTLGRSLAKRAKEERAKQLRVAVFYLIGLALMLWATPWPFREIGHGRGWL